MDPLETFEAQVQGAVEEALAALGAADAGVDLETPPDPDLGDLALPCFPLAAILQEDPQAIAGQVAERMPDRDAIGAVRAEGPYVNVEADPAWLAETTLDAVRDEARAFGHLDDRDRHVILEHTSANPTGPFHVGRARNPIVGDALARILDAGGWEVRTEYYVNDVGRQAAILAWGLANVDEADLDPPERDKPDHASVRYYRAANEAVETDADAEEAVQELLRALERADPEALDRVRDAAGTVLEGMKATLARLGVTLDGWVWESSFIADASVDEVIDRLKAHDHADDEEGAWYVDLEPWGIGGDDPRFVFTRRDGTSLYTTRDVAYHLDKLDRVGPGGRLVTVLGEDHKLQAKQLAIALSIVVDDAELTDDGIVTADGTEYAPVFYAFVSLPDGKMSTRAGRVVTADDLLDEAVDRAADEVRKRRDDLTADQVAEIAEQVGVGAVRFNIVDVQPEKAMTFRWEEALSFEGEAAPFVQYAHARASSILRKADDEAWSGDAADLPGDARPLVRTLARLPRVVDKAARELSPHLVSGYCLDVAREFNRFYRDVPVLDAPSAEERAARLDLVRATKQVLANSLGLVGVQAPDEM